MNPHEIYQSVTQTIIELLESHLEDFYQPWIAFGQDQDYARNAENNTYYRGINQFLLSHKMTKKGYFKNQWLTFLQAQELGGSIIKNEKSTPIIFFKKGYVDGQHRYHDEKNVKAMTEQERGAKGIESIPILKLYQVFNVSQTKGLDPSFYEVQPGF